MVPRAGIEPATRGFSVRDQAYAVVCAGMLCPWKRQIDGHFWYAL